MHSLLPTGEGGAKRRMRGVSLAKALFVNAFFVTARPSPAASRHPLPVGGGNCRFTPLEPATPALSDRRTPTAGE